MSARSENTPPPILAPQGAVGGRNRSPMVLEWGRARQEEEESFWGLRGQCSACWERQVWGKTLEGFGPGVRGSLAEAGCSLFFLHFLLMPMASLEVPLFSALSFLGAPSASSLLCPGICVAPWPHLPGHLAYSVPHGKALWSHKLCLCQMLLPGADH